MSVQFWRCDRCKRVRLLDEQPTRVTIIESVRMASGEPVHAGGAALDVCPACVRQLTDEAHARGGLPEPTATDLAGQFT